MTKTKTPLTVIPIQTPIFQHLTRLDDFICAHLPPLEIREGMILAVTSKIVSLAEGRIVARASINKKDLIEREADFNFGEVGYGCFLTVKEGMLIPSAGVDESNSMNDDYILYPAHPYGSARSLWQALRKAWGLERLGVILTDSHTTPLRRGVTGICLAYAGFQPLKNLVGQADLFGRKLKMTHMNLADGLAAMAVFMMGESNESTPLAVIHGASVEFGDIAAADALRMPLEEDLYFPFLRKMARESSF